VRCTVAVLALLVGVRCGSAPEEPPAVRAVAPAFKTSLDTIRGDWFIVASNPNPEIRNRVVTDYITYRFAEGGSVTKEITSRGKTERQTGSYTFDPASGLIHVRLDLGKAGVQLTSWRQLSADEAKTVHWKNVSLGYEHPENDFFVKEGSAEWQRREKIALNATDSSLVDPQRLSIGRTYRLSKETPLMPEVEPSDPIGAIERIKRMPAGSRIRVLVCTVRQSTPWYKVQAAVGPGNTRVTGWVNSIALLGQRLSVEP